MTTSGLSKERLDAMHDVLARHVEQGAVTGLVSLVSRRGETHVDATGTMAIGTETPIERDTIFRVSSMTKPVTAAAAMTLVEDCTLRLDDPVDELLPELADRVVLRDMRGPVDDTVPAARPITMRDLLTFRLGHGLVWGEPGEFPIQDAISAAMGYPGPPQPAAMPAPDRYMKALGSLPLVHQPGERWLYNTGADVLGVLLERATGTRLDAVLRERLFEPLEMKDTAFSVPAEQLHRLPTSYSTNPATGALDLFDEPMGHWSTPPAFQSGAGGLVSTVDDFVAFAEMLMRGGDYNGERILSPATVRVMTADHLTPEQKAVSGLVPGQFDAHGWGFGMGVVTRADNTYDSVGKYGWDGGMGTSWNNDPAAEIITILMTQSAWVSPEPPAVCRDFWSCAYAAIDD